MVKKVKNDYQKIKDLKLLNTLNPSEFVYDGKPSQSRRLGLDII